MPLIIEMRKYSHNERIFKAGSENNKSKTKKTEPHLYYLHMSR